MTPTTIRRCLVTLRPKRRSRPVNAAFEDIARTDLDLGPPDPDADPAGPALPAAAPSFSPAPAVLTRKRILVVDNEPASTRLVRLTLERCGLFEICEVNDPLRALAVARRFQPHLVLLDIEMPGLDGSGVARQLREDPAFRRLPLLFMTSLVTPEEAEQNLYAAGSRVLAKPVTVSKLLQSIAEMLSNILATGSSAAPSSAV